MKRETKVAYLFKKPSEIEEALIPPRTPNLLCEKLEMFNKVKIIIDSDFLCGGLFEF